MIKALTIVLCLVSFAAVVPANSGELPSPVNDADYRRYSEAQVMLGRLLFYDRVLSGTYRVSCATCHNHDRASSNGFRLDGKKELQGDELAINGSAEYQALKPSSRHAPALFNLGAREFTTLFIDGRVEKLAEGSFRSPASKDLPEGLQDVLAVQALFPAVTSDELVGVVESDLTSIAHNGNSAIWAALAKRVADLPGYLPYFKAAFDKPLDAQDITIVHIANALSAFVGTEWRSDNSAFDRYLRGDENALSDAQTRGMKLFYGEAGCDTCHAGKFQTDHKFHRTGFPDLPFNSSARNTNRAPKVEPGRFNVTQNADDLMHYRTPSLRNVARTGPYGHLGGFETLREALQFHYPRQGNGRDSEIDDLKAFLESLTDQSALRGRFGKPTEVPSSLALD